MAKFSKIVRVWVGEDLEIKLEAMRFMRGKRQSATFTRNAMLKAIDEFEKSLGDKERVAYDEILNNVKIGVALGPEFPARTYYERVTVPQKLAVNGGVRRKVGRPRKYPSGGI